MLLTVAGIGLDLTYKVGSFLVDRTLRLIFGKPKIEKRLDDLFMKLEEQRVEIQKLEGELLHREQNPVITNDALPANAGVSP